MVRRNIVSRGRKKHRRLQTGILVWAKYDAWTYIYKYLYIYSYMRKARGRWRDGEGGAEAGVGGRGREKNAEGRRGENERVEVLEFTCD